MEIRLLDEKLERTRREISAWLAKKSAKKWQILSLVVLLQHATKVVRCGRFFLARMYRLAAKVKEGQSQGVNLFHPPDQGISVGLYWWHLFIHHWNGLSLLHQPGDAELPSYCIQTDASGAWGCWAIFGKYWLQWPWSEEWSTMGIMAKELATIVLCCAIWGPILARCHVLFQCDNNSLVSAINKGYSKDPVIMRLLRSLWFFVAVFDIKICVEHIAGISNCGADMLSRNNLAQFSLSYPQVCRLPAPIYQHHCWWLWPDWTTPSLGQLFATTMQLVQNQAPGPPTTAGQKRYLRFCSENQRQPLPNTEHTLMLFVTDQGLHTQPLKFI